MDERLYWLGFSAFPGVGPVKFKLLLDNFGSAKAAWDTSSKDLIKVGFGQVLTAKFEEFKGSFSLKNYVNLLRRKGVSFTCWNEDGYPSLLKKIKNPPFVLYIKEGAEVAPSGPAARQPHAFPTVLTRTGPPRGAPRLASPASGSPYFFNTKTIAIVGTRKITQYGREVTELLTQDLVAAGFTIVSGLALGVDSLAHKMAIESGGKTIAVLGSGVDLCYPSSNKPLYNSIVSGNGAVVSEFPLGLSPSRGSFPSRNRIIAGLSLGVLVTEGAQDSGALITADYALKNGRKVFAVPGPITSSLSKGPYKLISRGAKLVTSADDILREFKISAKGGSASGGQNSNLKTKTQNLKLENATKEEKEIMHILENEPLGFDQILRLTKLDSANLGSLLSIMEVKGLVKSQTNGMFSIAS